MPEVTIKADPIEAPKEALLPSGREYYVIKTFMSDDNKSVRTQIIDGPLTEDEANSIRKLRSDSDRLNAAYNVAFREKE